MGILVKGVSDLKRQHHVQIASFYSRSSTASIFSVFVYSSDSKNTDRKHDKNTLKMQIGYSLPFNY